MNQSADMPSGNGMPVGGTFVPADFEVPDGFIKGKFRLVPLGPEHNERDYRAWTTSMEHIRRTPGFEKYSWPTSMTIDENMGDLVQHAADFRTRAGFTYSVMSEDDDVIGCVYIYPAGRPGHAVVRSWVRKDYAHLDAPLYHVIDTWLRRTWPFAGFSYAPRSKQYEFAN
ncbi:N-acetyltransferase [Streptomyces sp. NBC_01476]|uniref:N-acetyltransferase n=1 Tax=Streptomyces sp. NBC_01476 TaxID=2903881 RepID=UPI002E32EA05|nr:N-acetyltransferase [Streptomyces sp. NBC_01476]